MTYKTYFLFLAFIIQYSVIAQNTTCANMQQICQVNGATYQANTSSTVLPSTNFYDCLIPGQGVENPNWFFFQVSISGNIDMELVGPPGTDLDFVLWGPFSDQQAAISACGNLGNSPNPIGTADCGFLGGNIETPNITGGIIGEIYVFLVINYFSSQTTNFILNQTGGSGSIGCSSCAHSGTNLQLSHSIIELPSCEFSTDGSASVSAINLLNGTPTNNAITKIIWTSPTGTIYPGAPENDTLTNMEEGLWTVYAEDSCFNTKTIQFNMYAPFFPNINLQYLDGILTTDFVSYDSANTTYQWFNCTNDSIVGEVNDTLEVLVNGDYSLSVSINGCTNFSDCYTVTGLTIAELNPQLINVQIDPIFKKIQVNSELEINQISIFNLSGTLVHQTSDKTIDLDHIISGIYLIEVASETSHFVQKIVLR